MPAWWDQLSVGGRLVVPLRLHGSGLTRAIAFDLHQPDQMLSTSAVVCGFVPLRGVAEHADHYVQLAEDTILKLDAADLPDSAELAAHTTDLLHQWDRQRPSQPIITAHRAVCPTDPSSTGARVGRPHTVITIAW